MQKIDLHLKGLAMLGLFFLPLFFTHLSAQTLFELILASKAYPVSHRGISEEQPVENSLIGMETVLLSGIDFFEVDVRKNADGELYLLHDETLDRTTSGLGRLDSKSNSDLAEVQLKITGEPIPTFQSFLDFASNDSLWIMLDVKEPILEEVLSQTKAAGLDARSLVLTFDRKRAQEALGIQGDFLISVLVTRMEDLYFYQKLFGSRRFLAYVPKDAEISLFQAVAGEGVPILTDVMGEVDRKAIEDEGESYRDFLKERKINLLVSDNPLLLQKSVR